MVTLQDISERVNLSKATISLVLNGKQYHRVSEDTRKKIEKVAVELGYRPNRTAQHLAHGKTMNVMLLLNDLRNPFYATLASHIAQRLHEYRYHVLPMETLGSSKRESELLEMASGNVCDAVMCLEALPDQTNKVYTDLAARIPMVIRYQICGSYRPELSSQIGQVAINYATGITELWEHLKVMGSRHVGMLLHPQHDPQLPIRSRSNMGKFLAACLKKHQAWIKQSEIVLIDDELPLKCWHEHTCKLLESSPEIDTLYVHHIRAIPPVLAALQDMGRKPGVDMRIACIDNNEFAPWMRPALTVVSESLDQTAKMLVEQLLQQLKGVSTPQSHTANTQLIIRQSTTLKNEGETESQTDFQ